MKKSLSGNEIKEIRKAKKLKQYAFAELLGITPPYLSDLENGKKEASQQLINLILSKSSTPHAGSSITDNTQMQSRMDEIQKSLNTLHDKFERLGLEIGKIRDKMEEASQTGDIRRLGIAGGKGK